MAKGPDWNDVHRATPGAVRDALTEPDIPFDDPPARPNGHGGVTAAQIDAAIARAATGETKLRPATILLNAEDVMPETVNWIWKGWLASGKFHLIAGAPEAGKTTIALSLAAILSAADYWPDGTKASAGNVLIWCNEDDLADTILPRLIQMGADLKRIKFVFQQRDLVDGKPRPFDPSRDMEPLTQAAANIEGGVTMLILDPVVAAVGGKVDSHNNSQTRSALQPVKDFAEKANCAVVGISHFTKGTSGKDPIERVTGSLAFGALPRLVIAVCINGEEDGPERLFVRAKTNIGPRGGGFGFSIVALPLLEQPNITATRVKWGEALEGSAKELLDEAAPKESGGAKQEMAEGFLRTAIKTGEKRAPEDVIREAKACGISGATLRRAKAAAEVVSVQAKDRWWWTRK